MNRKRSLLSRDVLNSTGKRGVSRKCELILLHCFAVQRPLLQFRVPVLKDMRSRRAARTVQPAERLEAGR